ncbi:MAG: hypothetical protein QNJ37_21970 [Crocosphaera sp.]|nr:hypothetical protein [Crocosphaera sp.]
MITEEKLLEKWRSLDITKQEKVIEFLDSLEKSSSDDCPYQPLWDSLELFSDDFLETREQLPLETREVLFE